MRFPSRPIPACAQVMICFPFGEYPFHFRALLLCREEPCSSFLLHVCSGNGIVKDIPRVQLLGASHIGLICRCLSDRSFLLWKESAFLVEQRDELLNIRF